MKIKTFAFITVFLSAFLIISCKQDVYDIEKEHSFSEWTIETEPTCTSIGLKKRKCTGCGFEETETIPAKGHDWNEGIITTKATCTSAGVKTYTCSRCKEEKTEVIPANGHKWDSGFVTKQPKCTEAGIRTYTCLVCEEIKMESIKARGHSFDGIECKNCHEYSVKLSEIGKTYTDADGLNVTLNSFTYTNTDGYNNYSINYTLKNNIPSSEKGPGIFKIIYKTSSDTLESSYQTGFFNNLYYGNTLTRSYNWKLTADKTFVCLEYIADSQMSSYIFSSTPSDELLNWISYNDISDDENKLLSIELTPNITKKTNNDVTVNIKISNYSFLKMVKYTEGSQTLSYFESKGVPLESGDDTYSFTVTENGIYSVFVWDSDGRRETKEIVIDNIDKEPPVEVSNLQTKYDYDTKTITVLWQNPTDDDFDYVNLSCSREGNSLVSDEHIMNNIYSIYNVEVNSGEYVFTLHTVDRVGNSSTISETRIIPTTFASVESIELSRYHLAYNDSDQTITAIAKIKNINLIDDDTLVKFQIKDSDGSVTNTIATVDKSLGTATTMITVPTKTSNSDYVGSTFTVLCKIGDEPADSTYTARFNVSSAASLRNVEQYLNNSFTTDNIQIPLNTVNSNSKEIIRISGYNLDLAKINIQLFDSTGTAYYSEPIVVDTNSISWTATNGENYQITDKEISIPIIDDLYSVKILIDGIVQNNYSRQLQIYDVPKFTNFDIPRVSVTKAGNAVTAKITGKNFDTPDVDFGNFTAICSANSSVVFTSSFVKESDNVLYATFTIPDAVGEYEITVKYGSNSIKGTLKVQDFSNYSVGDVLLNDGTIIPYVDNLTFTDEQKEKAVGILYGFDEYGIPMGYVGIYNSGDKGFKWAIGGTVGHDTMLESIVSDIVDFETLRFTGDFDGGDNWDYICSIDPVGVSNAATNYPAFNYVNNYAIEAKLSGSYAKGWYMPSLIELFNISKNMEILNSVLQILDGVQLFKNEYYWSSSQYPNTYDCAWAVYFPYLGGFYNGSKGANYAGPIKVCVVRPF